MKDNLLKEQLAQSGLEMSIDPGSAMLISAGISAVTSAVGGLFGASEADQQNQQAEANRAEQQKLLNEQAKLQNEYNKEKFEVDKENYRKQADYNFGTAIQTWQYDMTLRSLQE